MHQTGAFNHADMGTFQALELPYVGKDLSMLVLLPKKADGLTQLEKALTSANLEQWQKKMDVIDQDRWRAAAQFEKY